MIGSGETDFGPQIENLNKKLFTVVAWDPRGYGHSRPPDRDFPVDFFERDAKDAIDLMKVGLGEESGGRRLGVFVYFVSVCGFFKADSCRHSKGSKRYKEESF